MGQIDKWRHLWRCASVQFYSILKRWIISIHQIGHKQYPGSSWRCFFRNGTIPKEPSFPTSKTEEYLIEFTTGAKWTVGKFRNDWNGPYIQYVKVKPNSIRKKILAQKLAFVWKGILTVWIRIHWIVRQKRANGLNGVAFIFVQTL